MEESTTLPIAGPMPGSRGRPDRPPPRAGPGSCSPRPSRPRSPPGSTPTPTSRDEAGRRQVVRNGYLPERTILTGLGAVEVKQPRVHDRRPARRAGEVHLGDPAAVPAEDQEHRGADPLAVPQGRQHRRLLRGPRGPARPRRPGAVGHHRHPAQGGLGGGVRGLEQAVAGGQALRLRLGRRRAFQHPPGGGPAVHPGPDGGDRRRARRS